MNDNWRTVLFFHQKLFLIDNSLNTYIEKYVGWSKKLHDKWRNMTGDFINFFIMYQYNVAEKLTLCLTQVEDLSLQRKRWFLLLGVDQNQGGLLILAIQSHIYRNILTKLENIFTFSIHLFTYSRFVLNHLISVQNKCRICGIDATSS